MARYMIQASYTKEAAAALVKKPEDRSLAVRPFVEKLGGRLIDFYYPAGLSPSGRASGGLRP